MSSFAGSYMYGGEGGFMVSDGLRIIWEERGGSKSRAFGGVDTTFSNVKQVLADTGMSLDDFNASIVGAKVLDGGMSVSCILWCSGAGGLFQGLKDRGLCRELPKRI